jgi:hypothetical protein
LTSPPALYILIIRKKRETLITINHTLSQRIPIMSRETQFIGLNPSAKKYIEEHAIHSEKVECPHCHNITGGNVVSVKWGNVWGGIGEVCYELQEYTDKDTGEKFREFECASPWSSGPVIFLALEHNRGIDIDPIKETLWNQEEIEAYL